MAAKPYMPFYTKDYLEDTSRLSTEEHGAYLLLIIDYWNTEKPLPDDVKILSLITKLSPKRFQKVFSKVKLFFTKKDGHFYHKRIEQEIKDYKEKASNRASQAKKAAETRWDNDARSNAPSMPGALLSECSEQCSVNAISNTNTNSITNTTSNTNTKITPTPSPEAREKKLKKQQDIKTIFEYWQKIMSHNGANLSEDRIKVISSGLAMGYTSEQLCEAIRGCSMTPFYMGDNDRGETFDGLKVIFKSADQIDKFLRYAKNPPRPINKTEKLFEGNKSVVQSWVERKKQEIKNE